MLVQKYPMTNESDIIMDDNCSHRRKIINGKMTDSAHCKGYCGCNTHLGYLTDKLVNKHRCHQKQCTHFYSIIKNFTFSVS